MLGFYPDFHFTFSSLLARFGPIRVIKLWCQVTLLCTENRKKCSEIITEILKNLENQNNTILVAGNYKRKISGQVNQGWEFLRFVTILILFHY